MSIKNKYISCVRSFNSNTDYLLILSYSKDLWGIKYILQYKKLIRGKIKLWNVGWKKIVWKTNYLQPHMLAVVETGSNWCKSKN